jgi:hypothetical protein
MAASPEAALRRYALAYINWRASSLPSHERALAAMAIGPARLAAEQTAASQGAFSPLAAEHVQNSGVVEAVARGQGPARGQWVVVTQERTSGTGAYSGLPSAPHVTLGAVTRLRRGWVVSRWRPAS